jgi:RimJ/RimL family protein N-acetyltransferase
MIRYVTDADLERVRVFLEAHVETSVFLLSNLAVLGPRLGEHFNSGNYKLVEAAGQVTAVFCLTRRGNLLVQAGGRAELAEPIFEACEGQPIEVRGVIGEWPTAEALWQLLRADPRFEPTLSAKDLLYRLPLSAARREAIRAPAPGIAVRALDPEDFEQWERLNTAYLTELHLPLPTPEEQRKAEFVSRSHARLWWGAFDGPRLVATVGLNATYGSLGPVGGVYTPPEGRKQGLARAAMSLLIEECRDHHGFEKLILFTGEDNQGARRLYESLGFEPAGAFGLLLGSRRSLARAQVRHEWRGQSGEVYTYEVHEWPTGLSPGPGNFIFATSTGDGAWRPVLIGECPDLSTLAAHDRLRSGAGRHPATHLHVRLNFNPAAVRRREASDLEARWLATDDGSV